jgi:hypothetical protein
MEYKIQVILSADTVNVIFAYTAGEINTKEFTFKINLTLPQLR